jgi:hypothetical protein
LIGKLYNGAMTTSCTFAVDYQRRVTDYAKGTSSDLAARLTQIETDIHELKQRSFEKCASNFWKDTSIDKCRPVSISCTSGVKVAEATLTSDISCGTPPPATGSLTWSRKNHRGGALTCTGGKFASTLLSSPGGSISQGSPQWSQWCYGCRSKQTIESASTQWQGVQWETNTNDGYYHIGLDSLSRVLVHESPSHSGYWSAWRNNVMTFQLSCVNTYAAVYGRSDDANGGGVMKDAPGGNSRRGYFAAGDTLAIMFKSNGNGGLTVEYRHNNAAFYTQDTNSFGIDWGSTSLTTTNLFPVVIDMGFYNQGSSTAPITNIQLLRATPMVPV